MNRPDNTMTEKPPFTWIAKYQNGLAVAQYNEDGTEISTERLPAKQTLYTFSIINRLTNTIIFMLHFDPGQRLIYRRRVRIVQGGESHAVYLVGWQQLICGRNVQSIAYIFEPSGYVLMAGKFREDNALMCAPAVHPGELHGT